MAKSNVSQKQEAPTSKYTHGVTPTQVVILNNIADAVDGLTAALSSEEPVSSSIVKRLPKTRSGKIVRGTIKKIADGLEYRIPPTIDDPAILEEITGDLTILGYPHR
jgi:uncharacterized protein YwbE